LLIVLAACRILPKPAIKWFWLFVGIIIIALIIWVFLPEDNGDWRPYTFDEELAAIKAKRAIPDEENAAIIYNQLLKNYDEDTPEPNFVDNDCYDLTMSEPWASDDHPEIAQWLKDHQSTITKLLEASKVEKCRFPIEANIVTNNQWSTRSQTTRHWALLFITAASNDIAEGRIEQALEKQIAVLQMGKHQRQQPTINDTLVGIAIEALAIGQFKRFIIDGDATEAHLSVIEKALIDIKHDWSYDLPRILEGEKLLAKNMLCSMAYEVNPKGKLRLSRDPSAAIRAQFPEEIPPPTYWRRKLTKAGTILGWFGMPSTPQKAVEVIDSSYEILYAMAEPDFDWQKEPRGFSFSIMDLRFNYRNIFGTIFRLLANLSEESYYQIHDLHLRHILSGQRGSRIIIALRRYKNKNGRWPESLDDIKSLAPAEIFVDPVNDDSFVYKLTEENFTLYSKGKNNIDENGEYNSTWDPNSFEDKVEEDDRLIWPRSKRKIRS